MKPDRKFFAIVTRGRIQYHSPELLNSHVSALEGKEIEVIVRERKKNTSLDQHAYYRGVILQACFASETFSHYDKADDIHDDYFAPKFLSYIKDVLQPDGTRKQIMRYRSTSELSTKEMSDIIERVTADCAEHQIFFATPGEYYSKLYNK